MSHRLLFFLLAGLACAALLAPHLHAQVPDPDAEPEEPTPEVSKTISSITSIQDSIRSISESIVATNKEIKAATTEAEKVDLTKKLTELIESKARLNDELQEVITGIDLDKFDNPSGGELDISAEFREFLRPLLTELKDVTAKPRELENLRGLIANHKHRAELAKRAVDQITQILGDTTDSDLKKLLGAELLRWQKTLADTEGDLERAQFRLDDLQNNSESLFSSFTSSITSFARTRGLNLLLAVLVSVVVFFILRLFHRLLHRLGPFQKAGRRSFGIRLIDVAYYLFNIVAAALAALITLYVAGDWIMLGLFLLIIFGIVWTGKAALPHVYEQAKLMLNLGSVREGERLIYDGIPWEVKAINVFSVLVNHELESGEIRLPLKSLVPLHSRPFRPQELFFPCKKGDWTLLPDGRRGKIVAQTPDWVQMIHLGGSRTTFATSEFVTLQPQNLSTNFRVRETFGVDYQHQAICTTQILETLELRLTQDLTQMVTKDNLVCLNVEFKSAGASSLDYAILADFKGEVAASYERLHRAIQRICVDACNDHGWVIPFTQITVHHAAHPSES